MIRANRCIFFASSALVALGSILAAACDSKDDAPPTAGDEDASRADGGGTADADAATQPDTSKPEILVDASAPGVQCATQPCAVDITAGYDSVCVRMSDGTVRCWGSNLTGQLGRGPEAPGWGDAPAPVVELSDVTQIAGSGSPPGDVYCARKSDGTALCWGANENGVLGRKNEDAIDVESSPTPAPVAGLGAVTGVFPGYYVSCATLAESDVACWGSNEAAQIPGQPRGPGLLYPVTKIAVGAKGLAVGIADRGTVALTEAGLVSWGLSGTAVGLDTSVLGREVSTATATPGPIVLAHVSAVGASAARACALANGRVFCWGVGPIPGSDSVLPVPAGAGSDRAYAQTLAVGPRTACATLSDGTAACWGDNARGQLGAGDFAFHRFPTQVKNLAGRPVRMATMESATCALLENGSVQCWGQNDKGQLGTGTTDGIPHPEPQNVKFTP